MAVTTPPPPPPAPPQLGPHGPLGPVGPSPYGLEPAAASPLSQGLVAVVCALVIGLLFHAGDETAQAIWPIGALGVGIAVSVTGDLTRFFRAISGLAVGLVAMVVTLVVIAATGGTAGPEATIGLVVSVGAFALGLDWRQVKRLRPLPLLSGVAVIPLAGIEEGWAYPAAFVWFVLAMAALWSLEADTRAALDRPRPLGPASPAQGPASIDLARTIGFGLLLGLAAALLIGNPSCSFRPSSPRAIDTPNLPTDRLPQGGSGDVDSRPATPGELPPEYRMEGGDQERIFDVDEQGNRTFVDPETGERLRVTDEGGRTVIRDEDGRVVGELDAEGQVATDGEGRSQRYERDGEGGLVIEGEDGTRYRFDTSGDRPVLRDEDGQVVAEGDDEGGHLVIEDPEGNVLVPDPDGDGRIPMPRPGTIDGTVGSGGNTTVERYDDETVVTDERRQETRTYDQDEFGRDRVTVDGPDGVDTYVYDDRGDVPLVLHLDEDGNVIERWRYDADGVLTERATDGGFLPDEGVGGTVGGGDLADPSNPGGSDDAGAGDDSGDDGSTPDPAEDDEPFPIVPVLLGLVAVAAAVAAGIWAYRRWGGPTPPEPPWAQRQARRIDAMGAARSMARRGDETIVDYTGRLVDGPLPDDRLAEVGRVLSGALFSRREPTPERQAWVEATLAELDEAHPTPRRTDALRKGRKEPQPV